MDCCFEINVFVGPKSCEFFESRYPDIIKGSIVVDIVRAFNFFPNYFPSIQYDSSGLSIRLFVCCTCFEEFAEGYHFFKKSCRRAISWCGFSVSEVQKANGDMFCTWDRWHGLML